MSAQVYFRLPLMAIADNTNIVSVKVGHTTKSCAVVKAEQHPNALSEDDKLFWSYVQYSDRPLTLHTVMDAGEDDDDVSGAGESEDEESGVEAMEED